MPPDISMLHNNTRPASGTPSLPCSAVGRFPGLGSRASVETEAAWIIKYVRPVFVSRACKRSVTKTAAFR